MLISDFTPEIIEVIIAGDYEVYRGMLSIPWFARMLTPNTIVDWAIRCGVDVHFTIDSIRWTLNNKLHRGGDLPAKFTRTLQYYEYSWYYNDKCYRKNKHTVETYYITENLLCYAYISDNNYYHRIEGPALVYYSDGVPVQTEWYENDKRHRYSGPAVCYNEIAIVNGEYKYHSKKYTTYHIHGFMIQQQDYYDAIGDPRHIRS